MVSFAVPIMCNLRENDRVIAGMSEWLSLTAFWGTADIGVHVVHTRRIIITYTLESLSSLI